MRLKKVDKIETHAMRLYINIGNRIGLLPKAQFLIRKFAILLHTFAFHSGDIIVGEQGFVNEKRSQSIVTHVKH